jgi:hypothetical protein
MMKIKLHRISLIAIAIICLIISNTFVYGQDDKLTKEVQVVRPYEPSISDAFKINQMPQVEDTIRITPIFSYNLVLRPTTIDFPVNPIPSARMVAEPLTKVYRGYLKAGFGNYSSPLAEAYFSSSRSKDYSYGVFLQHNSSFGRVKLDNDEKVDAPHSLTNVSVFGKKIFEKSVLAGEVGFKHFGYNFYGYDTIIDPNSTTINQPDQMHRAINISGLFHSTHSDSSHLNYKLSAGFTNFADKFSMEQNTFNISANADKFFKIERVGGDISFTHYMYSPEIDSVNNTIFSLSPWIGLFGKEWRVRAGVSFTLDANRTGSNAYFYPVGQLSYDIVSHYVIPYVQFSGYLENNSYSKILSENPWVEPGLNVWNTNHKYIMLGGVKGNFSPRIAYNVCASFSLVDSMYFYVNKFEVGESYLENKFGVVYDNIQHKRFMGELTIAPTSKIKLFFQAEFNAYTMQDLEKPWHKPDYIGRAIASYNIQNKILLSAAFYAEGKRYIQTANNSFIEIDGLMDLNLSAEYRYNSRVSAFLNLNNITGNRYHVWYLYPVQQFNMRLGLTYAF